MILQTDGITISDLSLCKYNDKGHYIVRAMYCQDNWPTGVMRDFSHIFYSDNEIKYDAYSWLELAQQKILPNLSRSD